MKKIASPSDLESELRGLLASNQAGITREAMATKLASLADRMAAGSKTAARDKKFQAIWDTIRGDAADSEFAITDALEHLVKVGGSAARKGDVYQALVKLSNSSKAHGKLLDKQNKFMIEAAHDLGDKGSKTAGSKTAGAADGIEKALLKPYKIGLNTDPIPQGKPEPSVKDALREASTELKRTDGAGRLPQLSTALWNLMYAVGYSKGD